MWTPKRRCTPEHWMQTQQPRLSEAQSGSAAPQSAQRSLPGNLLSHMIYLIRRQHRLTSIFSPLILDRCHAFRKKQKQFTPYQIQGMGSNSTSYSHTRIRVTFVAKRVLMIKELPDVWRLACCSICRVLAWGRRGWGGSPHPALL